MKSKYSFVITAATAAAALLTVSANAQYRAVGDDGIAASPRIRTTLDERARSAAVTQTSTAFASVGYRPTGADGITASPRLRQQLKERGSQSTLVARDN